jgi:cytidylate kinase
MRAGRFLKMAHLIITIDGPAASGKSTVARLLARKVGARFLDTGAMYRAVTLAAINAGVDMTNPTRLLEVLRSTEFAFAAEQGETTVQINGLDVTEQIRRPDVTANARYIASATQLRQELVRMQREFAADCERMVTEGRDQGTVAFPDADVKFYLTAELAQRARRRQAESTSHDKESLEQIREAIEQRDKSDQSRGAGPLRAAPDAVVIDTTDLEIDEVVEKLLDTVRERCPGKI